MNTDLPQTPAPAHWAGPGWVKFLSRAPTTPEALTGLVCAQFLLQAFRYLSELAPLHHRGRDRGGHELTRTIQPTNTRESNKPVILLKTLTVSHCHLAWFDMVSSQNFYLLWLVDKTIIFLCHPNFISVF